jgi:hypothetical protein
MWQNYLLWAKGLFNVGRYFFEHKEKSLAILFTIFFKNPKIKGRIRKLQPYYMHTSKSNKRKRKRKVVRRQTLLFLTKKFGSFSIFQCKYD